MNRLRNVYKEVFCLLDMEKRTAKILVVFLVGLFLISLGISLVSAQTPYQDLKTWISEKTGGFGEDSLILEKILFFALVGLIVYSVANFIPLIKDQKPWLKVSLSVIVAILSTFWLAPQEVYSILNSYETLGIILTTFLPLIVLIAFTLEMSKEDIKYQWLAKFMWVGFLVILTWKFISPLWTWFTTGTIPKESGGVFGGIAYILTIIIAFVMIFWGDKIAQRMFKSGVKAGLKRAKTKQMARLEADAQSLRDKMSSMDPGSESFKVLEARLEEIQSQIDKL